MAVIGLVLGIIYAILIVVGILGVGLFGVRHDQRKQSSGETPDPLEKESNYWW